jgi:hypothetical protein
MTALAMQASTTISTEREVTFDTDSEIVGIDNRCTACISHSIDNFEGTLVPSNRVVKGFGGSRTRNVKSGTIRWSWEDDEGKITTFRIPNSYYVPEGNVRLLSPQHWAQTQAKSRKELTKCGERTDGNKSVLFWDNGSSTRTIELGKRDNVATFSLAPGYRNYECFCCEAGLTHETEAEGPVALPSGIISDDESASGFDDDERRGTCRTVRMQTRSDRGDRHHRSIRTRARGSQHDFTKQTKSTSLSTVRRRLKT